jgi:hypothetical protein
MSPWGVASGGCKPEVQELPLQGTGAARGKPPRSRAWLRAGMVRPRHVRFNRRESYPLSHHIWPTGMDDCRSTGPRPDAMQVAVQRVTAAEKWRYPPADYPGPPVRPPYRSGFRRARLGLGGNHHLPLLVECSCMHVGGSQRDTKASSPPKPAGSVGVAIVVGGWESPPQGEGPSSVGTSRPQVTACEHGSISGECR